MPEPIAQILQQLNAGIFLLIAMFIVMAFLLYHTGVLKARIEMHSKRIETLEKMLFLLGKMETALAKNSNHGQSEKDEAEKSSIVLTQLGQALAARIHARDMFEKYRRPLMGALAQKCPENATAADVQHCALNVAAGILPKAMEDADLAQVLKVTRELGVSLDDIWPIFGLYLRDAVLENKR